MKTSMLFVWALLYAVCGFGGAAIQYTVDSSATPGLWIGLGCVLIINILAYSGEFLDGDDITDIIGALSNHHDHHD
jgi:hypothetical protein